ncbi:hypothetical protein CDIK_4245, partial [Cucumispora dikerogammari]
MSIASIFLLTSFIALNNISNTQQAGVRRKHGRFLKNVLLTKGKPRFLSAEGGCCFEDTKIDTAKAKICTQKITQWDKIRLISRAYYEYLKGDAHIDMFIPRALLFI